MIPQDAPLPCRARPESFDAVLDGRGPTQRAVAACKTICGRCDYRTQCLNEWGNLAGIVAGLTSDERKTLRGGTT